MPTGRVFELMQENSRYIIGIDLGTTNSCAAYLDTDIAKNPRLQVRMLPIPQLTAMGQVEPQKLLPSFYYIAAQGEFLEGACKLPWSQEKNPGFFVGSFASEYGGKVPTRLVQSAKSWLCNQAANRKEKILPVESAEPGIRISPVEATAGYLRHILEAWNQQMAKGDPALEFQQQEIILTVPASFDEVARMLTIEAAQLAGFAKVTLLEEPQAAFYGWILEHETEWKKIFTAGDSILVCDVGGGTTDFSLIEVQSEGEDASLSFQRKAVGRHLLLGGDNMDQAVSHFLEGKLKEKGYVLDPRQWLQLVSSARKAKEVLLGEDPPEQFSVCIQGSGSRVVSGSLSIELTRADLEKLLVSGFFDSHSFADAAQLAKPSGLRTMGLPYETDPSITKHLAAFLQKAAFQGSQAAPAYVLFNGGSMKPALFRRQVLHNLTQWFGGPAPQELVSPSLDLAVSRGAAYFGKARRGLGVRIGGGIPRAYYLVIDVRDSRGIVKEQALTLLPRGWQEGTVVESERVFMLMPNAPVSFHLLTSHTRLNDALGDLVEISAEEMFPLPAIHTVLRYGKKQASANPSSTERIPVKLTIELSEIGILELWLKSQTTEHRWRLEFQLRSASGEENSLLALENQRTDEVFGEEELAPAKALIAEVYSGKGVIQPNQLIGELERLLNASKADWSTSLLRGLWEVVLQQAAYRTASMDHEARWWNLAGFLLRPGFGYPLDDFRVKDLWKVILGDLKKPKSLEAQIQCWICYRRIAGGLNKGQQTQLISDFFPAALAQLSPQRNAKVKLDANEYAEKIRMLASMEFVDANVKTRLGDALVRKIAEGRAVHCDYWALGRIGARHLARGGLVNVVSREVCVRWLEDLFKGIQDHLDEAFFMVEQLARKTKYREVNLPDEAIQQILNLYRSHPKIDRLRLILTEDTPLTMHEQERVYGEHLPAGLTLMEDGIRN